VHTWKANDLPAVFGQQRESSAGFGGSTAFVQLAGLNAAAQWTCDRGEFFSGGQGAIELPQTLNARGGSGLTSQLHICQSARLGSLLGRPVLHLLRDPLGLEFAALPGLLLLLPDVVVMRHENLLQRCRP
jgi:hypothetical protein